MSRSPTKKAFVLGAVVLAGYASQAAALDLSGAPSAAVEILEQGRGHNIVVGLAPHPADIDENGSIYLIARSGQGGTIYISRAGVSQAPATFHSGKLQPEMRWQLPLQDVSQYGSVDAAICAMTFPQDNGGSVELSLAYGTAPAARQTVPEANDRAVKAYDRLIELQRKLGFHDRAKAAEESRDRYLQTVRNAQAAKQGAENDSAGSTMAFKESWVLMDVVCN